MNRVATPGVGMSPTRSVFSSATLGLPAAAVRWAIIGGVAAGVAYALSPLTVLVIALSVPLCWWAERGLTGTERKIVRAMLIAAFALRFAAVIWLLLTADRNAASFAKFFGDEEFFQLRGFWLYNLWMGIPISQESLLYAYNAIGYSGYEQFLVFVQILVGPAPYGIHLLNSLMFIGAAVLLHKAARRSYGAATALVGLAVILFLPSLFSWSVSALKESLFVGLTVLVVLAAVQVAREPRWYGKLIALAVVVVGLPLIESVRPGGLLLTAGGIATGYAVYIISLRRWLQVAAVALAVLSVVHVARSGLPSRTDEMVNRFARYHRGHVFTPGHSYKLLDQEWYSDFFGSHAPVRLTPGEMSRYIVRAGVNYLTQPQPWNVESTAEVLFMPEQLFWYLLVVFFPIGAVFAFRRDALMTCLLGGYTVTNAAVLALNSGNIGTLVRHRALVIPFLVWISAVALVELLTRKGE